VNKIDLGQTLNTLANVGVIAGIIFLALELNQNNEFLELEAKATRMEILLDGWERIASDPALVALMIKDRNEEALTQAEEMQLNAYWMGYFLRREWNYENLSSKSDQWRDSFLRIYQAYGSMRRAWEGGSGGSVSAGKDNFSPDFVAFIEGELASER
jgi:hypothetical protein